jgi:hypothetical protein
MSNAELFDATEHKAIAAGSCVMIEDDEIVYAGPIKGCDKHDIAGKLLLLHPDDFAKLKGHVDKRRH